jgi:hypothetical protein
MAKRRIDPEERRRENEANIAWRQRLAERIAYIDKQLADRDATRSLEEARRARRAERIHRILTLGLGRAA